jgi:xanthine dehydrogenase accessory factor
MTAYGPWHAIARETLARGQRVVLVVVASGTGSTPRETGAVMLVAPDRVVGTVGGGHLEHEALRMAREALASSAPPAQWLVRFPLAARLGQCCGGVSTLCFATLDAVAIAWLDTIAACVRARAAFAIVGRIASAPADERLVVTADDARGSIGDATLDSAAVALARSRLAGPVGERSGETFVAQTASQTLLVHCVRPHAMPVLVFGNGHVGRALVQVLGAVDAEVAWIDAREEDFPAHVPANVEIVATADATYEVANAPPRACVVVMTHSHALDFDIVEAALSRDDWTYVGLIGSKSKRAQFERRLLARGTPPEALRRLTCPIGAGPLRGKSPGVIAVAAAAEILAVREASLMSPASGDSRPRGVLSLRGRGA